MKKWKLLTLAFSICGATTLTGCAGKHGTTAAVATPATDSIASAPATADQQQPLTAAAEPAVKVEGATQSEETAVPAEPAAVKAGLQAVYFGFDAYLLDAEARETLTRNAEWLKGSSFGSLLIEGHADERGSDDYNLALGEKRAAAARRYLGDLGIPAERMDTVSYGEDKPAVDGHDENAWSKNRRVELVVRQ